MLKILAIIGVLILLGAVLLVIYALNQPDDFRVARSQTITAPPEKIFPLLNDLHRFNEWNPFAKGDPNLEIAYSGPDSGRGATHSWDSTGRSGKGRLEITEVSAPSRIAMQLDILKPVEGHNNVVFTLQPNGNATEVTWAMTGKTPFIGKMMCLFFSMDRMVGGEFEKGLADLKAIAEGRAPVPAGQS
jgi:hypothetical protein